MYRIELAQRRQKQWYQQPVPLLPSQKTNVSKFRYGNVQLVKPACATPRQPRCEVNRLPNQENGIFQGYAGNYLPVGKQQQTGKLSQSRETNSEKILLPPSPKKKKQFVFERKSPVSTSHFHIL